jgi:hypothetical protein
MNKEIHEVIQAQNLGGTYEVAATAIIALTMVSPMPWRVKERATRLGDAVGLINEFFAAYSKTVDHELALSEKLDLFVEIVCLAQFQRAKLTNKDYSTSDQHNLPMLANVLGLTVSA